RKGMSVLLGALPAFWGPHWRREISVMVAGSAEQFATLAGGGADVAATTTAERIMFSPGAGAMTDTDLRTVLRHELFHYAARSGTAADAPVWLTEGVADYVARPPASVPPAAAPTPPTDAELATPGPGRSAAYDRAWEFATYVAVTYGAAKLRALYTAACGPGHTDVATAVRDVLGVELHGLPVGSR
ncbi:peptidase, partial [Mycobacterium sp. NAZ190054]|uniref:peptidase n=1 Tax=Mycobacterium sp. NAZ190054 TaxID=1747766 RepID=UPI00079228F2